MANRQVRLDPENAAWVDECAYDWDCSCSAAVNRLLRECREPPEPVMKAKPARKAPRVPRSVSPRLAAVLRQNAAES